MPAPRRTPVPDVIAPDMLWSGTTCRASAEQCPVVIEHVGTNVELRRDNVLMDGSFRAEPGSILRNVVQRGDLWGPGAAERRARTTDHGFDVPVVTDVISDEVEVLLWVACARAPGDRARRTTLAIARLLHRAGVSFAILGQRKSCTGGPARRLCIYYLYQEQARANIATLVEAGVLTIVASCPYCFETITDEHPALGGHFSVLHDGRLRQRLVADDRLLAGRVPRTVTYQDPCYLGRRNRVFDERRSVLDTMAGTHRVEMGCSWEWGRCCGAAGARMWLEERLGAQTNDMRADDTLRTRADIIATACPCCTILPEDASRTRRKQREVEVVDFAQLLKRSMVKLEEAQ